tara:strand:+ start:2080 stop:2823 length:744 start_codon:yes stop_codon:yes gene_type:complete
MKYISIIIPTYNDERIIKNKIIRLIKRLKKIKIQYEIIIINDGSNDSTKEKIQSIQKKLNCISLVNNTSNQGKSFAIQKGIKKSKYNHVILIDSDLPYFSRFITVINLLKKKYDFVYINRRHHKSKIINKNFSLYKIFRFFIGYLISLLLKIFISLDTKSIDTQAGLKGFKKIKKIKSYRFISKKFFLDIELIYLYSKLKKKIISVPVSYMISKNSTINIFSFKKNFLILCELLKVITSIILEKKLS